MQINSAKKDKLLRENEIHIFCAKWKAGCPELDGDHASVPITSTADNAISTFVFEQKDHFIEKGQSFLCRWLENGMVEQRELKA